MAFEGARLLTTRDSWIAPEKREKGWGCEGEGRGGGCTGGSGLPYSETVLYIPGSSLSLTRSLGHLISRLLLSISITKTTVKAERSDERDKTGKDGQADGL